jgi:hypothetical protein
MLLNYMIKFFKPLLIGLTGYLLISSKLLFQLNKIYSNIFYNPCTTNLKLFSFKLLDKKINYKR